MSIERFPFFVVKCDKCRSKYDLELWDVAGGEAYCTPFEVLEQEGWRESDDFENICPKCAKARKKPAKRARPAKKKGKA